MMKGGSFISTSMLIVSVLAPYNEGLKAPMAFQDLGGGISASTSNQISLASWLTGR